MCYAPVCHSLILRLATSDRAFDLHALATPPAFILSQDQTLNNNSYCLATIGSARLKACAYETCDGRCNHVIVNTWIVLRRT